MDEADRLLDMDFGTEIEKILKVIPRERHTYLFSATMTTKVEKLQRACLSDPVRISVASKYSTVSTLLQYYLFFPFKHKEVYLSYLLNEISGQTAIVFTTTVSTTQKLALMLRNLGFPAVCLHGQMPQAKRLGALNKFKSGGRNILIATDVASRGLDIPGVDVVVNYDVPTNSKDYIHRVGRTARAGKAGKSVTFVTQYDVESFQRIEHTLQRKLEEFPLPGGTDSVLMLQERVADAVRMAVIQMKEESHDRKSSKRDRSDVRGGADEGDGDGDAGDDEEARNASLAFKKSKQGHAGGKNFRGQSFKRYFNSTTVKAFSYTEAYTAMSERKVLNKYFPPDFDPAKIPRRKLDKAAQHKVRLMAPFSMQCITCGEYIYKGKKFNARKERVDGENYLGIQIFRFYIRCTRCSAELTFKTDPKNSDYICEGGAQRNFEPWREEKIISEELAAERAQEEEYNPMKALENRTVDSKREMDILDALDEIQTRNARNERVDADAVLERVARAQQAGRVMTEQQQEEEDARLARMIFSGGELADCSSSTSDDAQMIRRIGLGEEEYTASLRNKAKQAARSISSVNLREEDGEDEMEDLHALVRAPSSNGATSSPRPSANTTVATASPSAGFGGSGTLKRRAITASDLGIVKKAKPAPSRS
ncbi:hypothetical protein SeLEV6574_g07876 [Synchytrium endobioticum]|uniref:Splicing factor YJU2 n=1 Tax=Synchytrium endobioticum TaxID=286115 RepID=A0A507CE73_9FUNG|nr:hypothetical protein SeLEV6574_g07876 [Synchytrium endobioticum]